MYDVEKRIDQYNDDRLLGSSDVKTQMFLSVIEEICLFSLKIIVTKGILIHS